MPAFEEGKLGEIIWSRQYWFPSS